jgi:hypothetical protein
MKVVFLVRKGGWGLGNGLFSRARCGSCEEVGVLDERCKARPKKKEWV